MPERNLYDCVVGELRRHFRFGENVETLESKTDFVVFSHEPFGFVFRPPNQPGPISAKRLSKAFFRRDSAKKMLESLVCRVGPADRQGLFLPELEKIQDTLSPWCRIVHGTGELKEMLDDYMPRHDIGWNCDRLGEIYLVFLWIQLETENISIYKDLYKKPCDEK